MTSLTAADFQLAASARGVMTHHLGANVHACKDAAIEDVDTLLYDEMVFNK